MDKGIKDILNKPVQYLKGVGENRARLFNRLGIFTIYDIITHFPRDYEDRSELKKIIQIQDGESVSFSGSIISNVVESRLKRGLTLYKVNITDNTGIVTAMWFNQAYIKNVFSVGENYVFFGKLTRKFRTIEVLNPVYEKISEGEMEKTCRIVPIYRATANLTQNIIRALIKNALSKTVGRLEEILPDWIIKRYNLSEINYSIQNIHFPKSDEDFKIARYRLAFEELLLIQLGLMNIKNSIEEDQEGISFGSVPETQDFISGLEFKLTNSQLKVFDEIKKDMESKKVMNRLVQGDVGSGKTIVAVLALFKAVKSGYQGTLMVPTEILAEQHYSSIKALLEGYDIKVGILTGSQAKKLRNEVLTAIKTGDIDIVIGTHALIEENVAFKRLGLVVTDEQHRFGVRQRAILANKGSNPDVLVMTATPIPRTLALILYGDLDISIIDELPPGRKPIETYVVNDTMRTRINNFIRKKVAEGRQVYIVCPLVEESDEIEAKSAVELAEKIAKKDFNDLQVGLIHGKMKSQDKDLIMKGFSQGEINILVSTTVIEVGVNVPNSTVMVIENAERFGLSTLHQLRGRVGRGMHQSFCILYNEGKTDVSLERMKVMQSTNDGFVISEKDLELRGPGEFFGTMQHGLPDLKIANLYQDIKILNLAQEAAGEILKNDRFLRKDENAALKDTITEKFRDKLKDLSLN